MATALEIAERYRLRESLVESEFKKTAEGVRKSAEKFCKGRLVAEVYAIPEDRTKSGKKRWQRTHALLNAEKAVLDGPYAVKVINDRPYAEPRHEAGKPGRRKINPLRESHWRDELVETFTPLFPDLVHQTMIAILQRGGR